MQRKALEVTDSELVMLSDALEILDPDTSKAHAMRRRLIAQIYDLRRFTKIEEEPPRKPCCTPPKWCPDCQADRDHEARKD